MSTTVIDFKNIFEHYLKTNATSISIKTLLSERNIKRIKYDPYYQRNYVWDAPKQSFFIESVILGTEVPPLILFKSGTSIEVIDGRQRFETLKRFKESDFSLKIEGLKELPILKNKNFNKLTDIDIQDYDFQNVFLNSNIRVIEFEVINSPNINEELVDRVKKEIFRRYNTGITPLTKDELDNAKYDEDKFSELFKNLLRENQLFFTNFNECFFSKEIQKTNINKESLITKNLDFIRRYWILNLLPISNYAGGKERIEVINLLYDFAREGCKDIEYEYNEFKTTLDIIINIHNFFKQNNKNFNKLMYETILWAITILKKEEYNIDLNSNILNSILNHYKNEEAIYASDNSFHYSSIMNRFRNTASFFNKLTGINYDLYLKNEKFKSEDLRQTDDEARTTIVNFNNLRLNKPQSISTPIDEIKSDIKTSKYILRPSYQRQEKINEIKASAIIESILLKINLPPIFIYIREDGVKEVVDGQQRLLAILGFLGQQFSDENGNLQFPTLNNFKLKDLKILDLNGKRYSELDDFQQDKILDFALDIINIEQRFNNEFDPIDLFIRLNYKPYPIKNNSFEMWNSIVNKDVVTAIKDISKEFGNWFYVRDVNGKPDRMENEELITILSYIYFKKQESIIGLFKKQASILCRLKDKKSLGLFLVNEIENKISDKDLFIVSINKSKELILLLSTHFTKDSFNIFLNVKENKNFRRTLQDFYIIWVVMSNIKIEIIKRDLKLILDDIRSLLVVLKNVNNEVIDDIYFDNFLKMLENTKSKYQI